MFYNDSWNFLPKSLFKYFEKSKKVAEGNLLTQRSIPLKCFKTKSDLKRQMKYTKIFLKSDLPGNANINVFFTEKSALTLTLYSVFFVKTKLVNILKGW